MEDVRSLPGDVLESLARQFCQEDGKDPDDLTLINKGGIREFYIPQWSHYTWRARDCILHRGL